MACVQRRLISLALTSTSEHTVKSDLFLTRAIPSSLRDTGHPDKELVLMAITYALTAFKDANTMTATDATIAKHVHDALVTFEEKVFKPHLVKEDEDWNALKVKASRALPVVYVEDSKSDKRWGGGWRGYLAKDERYDNSQSLVWKQSDSGYDAEYTAGQSDSSDGTVHSGNGESPFKAMESAVRNSGAVLAPFTPNVSRVVGA